MIIKIFQVFIETYPLGKKKGGKNSSKSFREKCGHFSEFYPNSSASCNGVSGGPHNHVQKY